MKKKRAFTMVELIFVIVILGILAAVAVPKLNASRADAQTAKLKANLVTLAKDFESYYAANGEFCTPASGDNYCYAKLSDITSVPFDETHSSEGHFYVGGKRCLEVFAARYRDGEQSWTVHVTPSTSNSDCKNELDKDAYKDLKWFFYGYIPSLKKEGDARYNAGWYVRHLMNDPSKGVQFD